MQNMANNSSICRHGGVIGRRHGRLHSIGQNGAGFAANPSTFFFEDSDGNSILHYGAKDQTGTQAIILYEGENIGFVPALDSQRAPPFPRTYHCTITFSIGGNLYMARGIATSFPDPSTPFIPQCFCCT